MDKALLFPGPRIILHNLFLSILPAGVAVALLLQRRPVGVVLAVAVALFTSRDLGFVTVRPGRLTSYRLFRLPKRAETPAVLACDVDMVKRKLLHFIPTIKYWYPVLVLDSGKSIRLPLGSKSRDKSVHTAALLRKALDVPVNGQDLVPQGRLARTLSGSTGPAPEPEFGSEEWFKDQWT